MNKRDAAGLRNIDWPTFSLFLALVAIGWLMIYTVSFSREWNNGEVNFFDTSSGKQTIWMGISALAFAIVFIIDWKFWQTFAYFIYGVAIALLIAVLFLGTEIKGARAWFSFGGSSFQPSEVAKFGTSLAMAAFLSYYRTNLKEYRSQFIAFGLLLLPIALILLQPDAGSAIVFFSFLVVLYREGLSPNYYVTGIFCATMLVLGLVYPPMLIITSLGALSILILANQFKDSRYWVLGTIALIGMAIYAILNGRTWEPMLAVLVAFLALGVVLWNKKKARIVSLLSLALLVGAGLSFAASFAYNALKPHQQDRINVWLKPDKADKRGSLYNLHQSKLAIGSGGFTGKGLFKGTLTKLNYVPEQSTDFIFCTIGEEQGFVGSVGLIVLFALLLIRITNIAERQRSNFSRHYAYCVAGILFIHVFINIGMTMGLLPIIGIPLPFISKGGSSLLGFTVMIAVLLKLDSHRYKI
ncbi:MAG: rod shape-determining protein RodA [Saprospiraceae bacterium]